jgi:hypothetical protein
MLLADAISCQGMPYCAAIPTRVSPDFTTYVAPDVLAAAGVEVGLRLEAEAEVTVGTGLAVAVEPGVTLGAGWVAPGAPDAVGVTVNVGVIAEVGVMARVVVIAPATG